MFKRRNKDWLKNAITTNVINYYDYSKLTNMKEISRSSTGNISQANWKGTLLIVKSSCKLTVEDMVNELKIQQEVNFHAGILRFYGISKFKTGLINQMKKYLLVFENADGGSLYSYLKKKFDNLSWLDKYNLALQLATAVEYIHSKNIIHCDLDAYNVLVHQNKIKIANFGLSRKITETEKNSNNILGLLPYVDPKCLNIKDENTTYKMSFKSDIYSIGVLLWQLSSGCRPFYPENVQYDSKLAISIKNGKREKIIKDTPVKYSNLYTACWPDEPNKRPTIQQVILSLKSIIYQDADEKIMYNEKKSFMIVNDDFDLIIKDYVQDYNLDIVENEVPLYISKQAENSFKRNFNLTDNIDKLITLLIETQEKGHNFMEIKQLIIQCILLSNQAPDHIFEWLTKNQTKSKYIFFFGFLYYNGIIVDKNGKEAFQLFSKASKDNCSIAQVYLSECYLNGIGTDINNNLGITLLHNAIKNNSICGELYLGNYYENGDIDLNKAFYHYQKAADNGNLNGLYYLGKCYEFGKGINKNESKAFELYKKSADQGYINAQYKLAYCYDKGIGTSINKIKAFNLYKMVAKVGNYGKIQNILGFLYQYGQGTEKDLEKAFYWYQRAANNESKFAQYNLGNYYQYGIGHVEKDVAKAFEWYKKSAKQEYSNAQYQLGIFYENGIRIKKDLEKAFYWYQKAAKNGNESAQYNLGMCYENGKGIEEDKIKAFEWYELSATQGYSSAQQKLSIFYDNGIGTEKDLKKAIYWYQKAEKNGKKYADKYYQNENGIEKDKDKVFEWCKRSAKNGNIVAQYNLSTYYYQHGIGIEKDLIESFEWCKKSAEQEYSNAQNQLGSFYKNGIGVKKDLKKAFYWYQKAAKNGNKDAQYNMGCCYENGKGIEKDKIKAFEWYKKSAEQEYSKAQNLLGVFYENGIGVKKDFKKAFYWYQKAAENGNESAQYNLGICFKNGLGIEKNEAKAFECYKKSAKQECSGAQNNLGLFYKNGIGTEKDLNKAIYWYQKAAENGNKYAQYNLGKCYQNGNGVDKDQVKAFGWYKKSAENGNKIAQYDLGFYYQHGIGIEKDIIKSFEWYKKSAEQKYSNAQNQLGIFYENGIGIKKKAADNGNKVAQSNLGLCYENGKGIEKDEIIAFEWYNKSASQEYSNAQNKLGIFYEIGKGITKNLEIAFYWYHKAAENGNKVAQSNLGLCYENGKGIKKDKAKAFEWYKESAKQGCSYAQQKLSRFYKNDIEIKKGQKVIEKGSKNATEWIKIALEHEKVTLIPYDELEDAQPLIKIKKGNKNASEWIENALKYEKVKFISYNELEDAESLSKGGFGYVMKAIWTKTNNYVVYKRLINTANIKHDVLDAFIHELQIHLHLDCSDRIVRCLGISQDQKTNDYLLIMQYANGGDLQSYLKDNFKNLSWNDKKRLAFQIADGLNYLHNENVLHRDLHSKNIVIHENNAKITDFGISKNQNNQNSTVYMGNFGVIAYVEPKRILDPKFPYTKSSDIYSLGVLMWEISSGYSPFKTSINCNDKVALAIAINNGTREDTIPDTPNEYEELYKGCWKQEPIERPTISEVLNKFAKMGFGINTKDKLIEESTENNNNLTPRLQSQLSTSSGLCTISSKDHKPTSVDKQKRINQAGGFVGGLTHEDCEGCVCDDKIETETDSLVLASDGIWDCKSSQKVVDFIYDDVMMNKDLACENLMEIA